MSIFETSRRMTAREQAAYDLGFHEGKNSAIQHGRWKKNWHDNNLIGHEYEECSVCGCMISDTEKFWDCNFCPNCGARMDGEIGG